MKHAVHPHHPKKRKRHRRRGVPGAPPGTITVDPCSPETIVRVIAYCKNGQFVEKELNDLDEIRTLVDSSTLVWLDVVGLGSKERILKLGELLSLHALALEDVVNVHQRAKVDSFEQYLFVVARMIDDAELIQSEQISFFLKKNVLITFQERIGDCWEAIRMRLRQRHGKVSSLGPDYLLYALLDSIIDSYFPVLDRLSDSVDVLEDEITKRTSPQQMMRVHHLRGQLLELRRSIRPHREMINELSHHESNLISAEAHVFIRDCYDHVIQLIDGVDTYRELTSDLRDYYLSMVSNSMNEVMKLLTIISTIFIPLSFVASVYGMNFDTSSPWNMPELKWRYGYPMILAFMACVGFGMIWLFRRRRWL